MICDEVYNITYVLTSVCVRSGPRKWHIQTRGTSQPPPKSDINEFIIPSLGQVMYGKFLVG